MQIVHLSNFHPFWMALIRLAVQFAFSSAKLYGTVSKGENLVCILQIRGLHEIVPESGVHTAPAPADSGPEGWRRLRLSGSDTPKRWKESYWHL